MTNESNGMLPIRIQITCNGVLQAEVICHQRDVDRIWSRYAIAKYRADKPVGGACSSRADMPRYWNVSVGSTLPQKDKTNMELDPISEALKRVQDTSLASDKSLLHLVEKLIEYTFTLHNQVKLLHARTDLLNERIELLKGDDNDSPTAN